MGYLSLTEFPGDYIVIYRQDAAGNPILDPGDVLIVKISSIENERAKISLNGDSYKIVRYTALRRDDSDLKRVVDEKLRGLEHRAQSA